MKLWPIAKNYESIAFQFTVVFNIQLFCAVLMDLSVVIAEYQHVLNDVHRVNGGVAQWLRCSLARMIGWKFPNQHDTIF